VTTAWRLRPENDGPELRLGDGSHILGSSSDADLVVANPTVSRRHVRFEVGPAGVTIEDPGSTNGTAVNGVPDDGGLGQTEAMIAALNLVRTLMFAGSRLPLPSIEPTPIAAAEAWVGMSRSYDGGIGPIRFPLVADLNKQITRS
jgi:hypothetical protein